MHYLWIVSCKFLGSRKIHLFVSRKKFLFDLVLKLRGFEKCFLASDKIVFHNCGLREDIEDLA